MLLSLIVGMTAVMATYPLDMIRARLAFQVAGEDIYLGICHAFKVIVTKEGGFKALYRGIVPTMIGMVPYAGKSASVAHQGRFRLSSVCVKISAHCKVPFHAHKVV